MNKAGAMKPAFSDPSAPLTISLAAIDSFCDALWLEHGLAKNTLDAYRRDLRLFAAWLAHKHCLALIRLRPPHCAPISRRAAPERQAHPTDAYPCSGVTSDGRCASAGSRWIQR